MSQTAPPQPQERTRLWGVQTRAEVKQKKKKSRRAASAAYYARYSCPPRPQSRSLTRAIPETHTFVRKITSRCKNEGRFNLLCFRTTNLPLANVRLHRVAAKGKGDHGLLVVSYHYIDWRGITDSLIAPSDFEQDVTFHQQTSSSRLNVSPASVRVDTTAEERIALAALKMMAGGARESDSGHSSAASHSIDTQPPIGCWTPSEDIRQALNSVGRVNHRPLTPPIPLEELQWARTDFEFDGRYLDFKMYFFTQLAPPQRTTAAVMALLNHPFEPLPWAQMAGLKRVMRKLLPIQRPAAIRSIAATCHLSIGHPGFLVLFLESTAHPVELGACLNAWIEEGKRAARPLYSPSLNATQPCIAAEDQHDSGGGGPRHQHHRPRPSIWCLPPMQEDPDAIVAIGGGFEFHLVTQGRKVSVWKNWTVAKSMILGYPGAAHKGHDSYEFHSAPLELCRWCEAVDRRQSATFAIWGAGVVYTSKYAARLAFDDVVEDGQEPELLSMDDFDIALAIQDHTTSTENICAPMSANAANERPVKERRPLTPSGDGTCSQPPDAPPPRPQTPDTVLPPAKTQNMPLPRPQTPDAAHPPSSLS
ncbi:hypothetical protein B0H14DRAFT_2606845 [Mycena olivaceomarginata]|nr:hypothetical protein B0H14DRAFT_2606845 [Mycena olivaceomarginata]